MQNRKSRIKNKIAIIIVITMLIASVFSIFTYAANTSTVKLAQVIYKLDTSSTYYIEEYTYTSSGISAGYYTYGSTDYLMNYLNISPNTVSMVFYQTEENKYTLLKANSTSQTYSTLTIDADLNLKCIYRCYNGYFRFGYNTMNLTIDPDDYTGAAKAFAYAYANRTGSGTSTVYAKDMFAVADANTQIVNQAIITGYVGDVYQGIISEDGNIYSTNTRYSYTLVNGGLQVSFGLQANISGVDYNERGLYLNYMLNTQQISFPADGTDADYTYDFGTIHIYNNTTSNNSISFFIYFNGTQYANTADPLHAFVTAMLLQAFEVTEFNDTQFIWGTPASINQELEIDVINNQLVIISLLENGETSIYQEFIDDFESAVSEENIPPIDISAENSYFESVWAAHEDDLTYYKSWFLTPLWNEWVIIEVITAALFLGFISYIIFGKKA